MPTSIRTDEPLEVPTATTPWPSDVMAKAPPSVLATAALAQAQVQVTLRLIRFADEAGL